MTPSQERIDFLANISGLYITCRIEKYEMVYEFRLSQNSETIKTIFTFVKAKVFAEGVAFGKTLKEDAVL